jgi:predicted outer membrane protein
MLRMIPAFLAILAVAGAARAQDQKPTSRERSAGTETQGLEGPLADCLILSNQEEIALLRFAQEKSENAKLKKFTDMAIQDHEKAIAELRKFASGHSEDLKVATKGDAGTSGNKQSAAPRREVTARKPATASGDNDAMMQKMSAIQHQATLECLAMTKEQLSKSEGTKFDQCFLGQQIGMHIGMAAKLKAFHNNTSGEFQQLTQKLGDTAKQHKDHAEKLLKEIEASAAK